MEQNKISSWRSHTIWGAVRTFGAIPYMNDMSDQFDLNILKLQIASRPDAEKFQIMKMAD
jgi:hypothetical protein